MGPVHIFEFASRQADWLAARQSVIASNIAHSDTPGYKAKDIVPFQRVLDRTHLTIGATHSNHLTASESGLPDIEIKRDKSWEMSHSGNSVRLEQELLKTGEVSRDIALNTSIVQTLHRMLMSTLRNQS